MSLAAGITVLLTALVLAFRKKGDLRLARAGAKRNPFVTRWHAGGFWSVVPASDDASRLLALACQAIWFMSRQLQFNLERD